MHQRPGQHPFRAMRDADHPGHVLVIAAPRQAEIRAFISQPLRDQFSRPDRTGGLQNDQIARSQTGRNSAGRRFNISQIRLIAILKGRRHGQNKDICRGGLGLGFESPALHGGLDQNIQLWLTALIIVPAKTL